MSIYSLPESKSRNNRFKTTNPKIRFDKNFPEHKYQFKVGDKVNLKKSQISDKLVSLNSTLPVNWKTRNKTKVNFDRPKPYYEK